MLASLCVCNRLPFKLHDADWGEREAAVILQRLLYLQLYALRTETAKSIVEKQPYNHGVYRVYWQLRRASEMLGNSSHIMVAFAS